MSQLLLLILLLFQLLCCLATKPNLFLGAARSSSGCRRRCRPRMHLAWHEVLPRLLGLGRRLALMPAHITVYQKQLQQRARRYPAAQQKNKGCGQRRRVSGL